MFTQVWIVGEDQHMFMCMCHHSITDGWASAMLQRELMAAYAAAVAGTKPQWEPLPVQVARGHHRNCTLDCTALPCFM